MKTPLLKENIFLPKTLVCGFRYRKKENDLYISKIENFSLYELYKVGFVAYYDEKGKMRHKTSLENWINKDIPIEEVKNEPTSGFRIFKQANRGKNRFSQYRNVILEIQDPRGWVFEITQNNLMWILDNSCINKGEIEGEFVYGWDGSSRILIPCSSDTYKDILDYTDTIQNQRYILPKELKPNYIYKSKQGERYMYVGKYKTYEYSYSDRSFYFFEDFLKMHGDEVINRYGLNIEKKAVITYERGYYYYFARLNDEGKLFTAYLPKYKNPKEKFIKEVGVFEISDELLKLEKFLKHNSEVHCIDYSKQYKWNFSEEDFYKLYKLKSNDCPNYCLKNDDIMLKLYVGKFPSVNNFVDITYSFDKECKFNGKYSLYRQLDGKYEQCVISSLKEFVEEYKPYCFYNLMDNDVKHVEDYQLKAFFNNLPIN